MTYMNAKGKTIAVVDGNKVLIRIASAWRRLIADNPEQIIREWFPQAKPLPGRPLYDPA